MNLYQIKEFFNRHRENKELKCLNYILLSHAVYCEDILEELCEILNLKDDYCGYEFNKIIPKIKEIL